MSIEVPAPVLCRVYY